jgi:putative ABC transport system permease protein
VAAARQPSGVEEENVFRIRAGSYRDIADPMAQQKMDEQLLRSIPGVRSVAMVNQMPLGQSGNNSSVFTDRKQIEPLTNAAFYETATSMVDAMGLKVIEGRDFLPEEYLETDGEPPYPKSLPIMISAQTGRVVFPDETSHVGRVVYRGNGDDATELRIVGVVEQLMTPWGRTSWGSQTGAESVITAVRLPESSPQYAVRVEPGTLAEVMKAADEKLVKPGDGRILQPAESMGELRDRRYRNDYFLSSMMSTMTGMLVLVTASGILGMASFWVGQRRKQIGVRRALGARRSDILRYYLLENFVVTSIGIGIGVILALSLNFLIAESLQLTRLPLDNLLVGMLLLWAVGQFATWFPARRAAQIAPATATRTV